jgi:G3E family GTPase
VLNKISAASPESRKTAHAIIRSLNSGARVVEADFGEVPLNELLHTGRFDFEQAHRHPLWYRELNGFKDHVPETEEYGVRSFVYRSRRPFHPARFQKFCNETWPGVVRAKGFFWLASRPAFVGELSQAGPLVSTEAMGYWWASVPKKNWPTDEDLVKRINGAWHEQWGDRRQELVFIGTGEMDKDAIKAELDACLLALPREGAVDTKEWARLEDPFPIWSREAA